jgi:hypothetical protein
MAQKNKHSLPKGINTSWAGNPPGGLRGKAKSSTRKPKPQGIKPGKEASYGILHGGNQSTEKLSAKAGRMFGNGSRNTPTGQSRLESKAKRQVC